MNIGNGTQQSNDNINTDKLLKNIITSFPGIVYWKDINLRFLGCNINQARLVGLSNTEDIIGLTVYDIIDRSLPPDIRFAEASKIESNDQQVIKYGKSIIVEEPLLQSFGGIIYFISHKIPFINDEGRIIGLIGISIDITKQKEYENDLINEKEKSLLAIKTKNEFLYNMRHDIRTPFSGILSLAESMANKESDPDKKENLSEIVKSSENLLLYLNEILEFTQIDSGKIPVLYKPFDLIELINDCADTFKPSLKHKNIEFIFNHNISGQLICDRFRIQRILINLLSNAVKFTHSGSITINCNIIENKKRDVIVKLSVSDTGIGIPPEKQDIIFEKFSKLSASYRSNKMGIGLGLRAVKELVDDLDGDIEIKSIINQGSSFTCIIPMKIRLVDFDSTNIERLGSYTTESKKSESSINNNCVLLVEDSRIAQIAAKNILSSFNLKVDAVETGHDAIDCFNEGNYEFILLDIGLPDMSGYDVVNKIRYIEKKRLLKRTPIIVITAHADEDQISKNSNIIDQTIIKPLMTSSINNILDRYCISKKVFS